MPISSGQVRRLIEESNAGSAPALDRLVPIVYRELRKLAAYQLRRERRGHSLQPTALVHEVYVRLAGQAALSFENWAHFRGIAARTMRRILVEHARARGRHKRGGSRERVSLECVGVFDAPTLDLAELDEALNRLAAFDERQAKLVELRFFAGMTVEETAEVLGISPATVKREWALARAWLRRELSEPPPDGSASR